METYILPNVKWIASKDLLYDVVNSDQCSVKTKRGGMGWKVGGSSKRGINTS